MKRKARNLKYLENVEKPFLETLEEFELKRSEGEELLDYFFKHMKDAFQDKRMPKVQITNLGVFQTNLRKVEYMIRIAISRYRREKITKDECDERVIRLWLIRRRLQAEKRGENTYRKWNKLKIEDEIQRIKDEKASQKKEEER